MDIISKQEEISEEGLLFNKLFPFVHIYLTKTSSPTFIPVIVTKVRDVYVWMLRARQEYVWNKKVQPMIFVTHCYLSNHDRSEKK